MRPGAYRIVNAAEDATRILPGKDPVDPRLAVAVPTQAAHLRRKFGVGRSCARITAVQAPVASSWLNTRLAPLRSRLPAISIDTGAGS